MRTEVKLDLSGSRSIAHKLIKYWYRKRRVATQRIMERLGSFGFQNEVATKAQISLYSQTMTKRPALRGDKKIAWTYASLPSSQGVAKMLALTKKYFLQIRGHGKMGYPPFHFLRTGKLARSFIRQMYKFNRRATIGITSPSFRSTAELKMFPGRAVRAHGWKLKYAYERRGKPYLEVLVAGVLRETFMDLTRTKTGGFANTKFCRGIFK